jgi:hypothetical protein
MAKASELLKQSAHIHGGSKSYEESDINRNVCPGAGRAGDGAELVVAD